MPYCFFLSLFYSVAETKQSDPKLLGENYLFELNFQVIFILLVREFRAGTQNRNYSGTILTDSHTDLCLASLLIQSRIIYLGNGVAHSGLGSPI